MEGYHARDFPSMVSTKIYTSYKVDEGYSEDTRSQDDPDSPMRMDPGGDDLLQNQMVLDAVMALSEGEKTGKPPPRRSGLKANLTKHTQNSHTTSYVASESHP